MRAIARAHGLPTSEKKDSTGICFIGKRDFRDFLARPAGAAGRNPQRGRRGGRHARTGTWYYTLGQREGLNVGGVRGRPRRRGTWWARTCTPTCCTWTRAPTARGCSRTGSKTEPAHWVSGSPPAAVFTCTAKTRYRQHDQDCEVRLDGDGRLP